MKVPKFITRGLVSGALRMRPEVMDAIKKLSGDSKHGTEAQPAEDQAPKPPLQENGPAAPPSPTCRSRRRVTFTRPLPVRWVRWSYTILAAAALCVVQSARARENLPAFDSANQTFADGKPAEAARGFENLITRQGYSAPVLFNLANAQLRAGKTGQAILNYERARWLAPRDPDIAANLRLAQEQTQAALPAAWPLRFADWFTMNGWAGLAAGSLLLLAATLPLALLLPHRRLVLRLARVLAVASLLSALTAIGARWGELNRAVVVAKTAPARISPVTLGSAMFTLPEGALVSIVKSHGPFTLVSTRDGRRGWVNRDAIERVISSVARRGN